MAGEAPPFWWEERSGWRAVVLAPAAWLYGAVAGRRLAKATPPRIGLPVLCIGNFTVGGAGKTPTAIAFAETLKARGLKPGIVSRGYGGSYRGLHVVDPAKDSAALVGDEPLLLARHAMVALSRDRFAAARHLQAAGCDFVIMDDGFQSARLHADFALLVVDAGRGIGNGRVIPAGPLRAPLIGQMRCTDALLRIGKGEAGDFVVRQAARAGRPVYEARLVPSATVPVTGRRWLAFAGIGNPGKFYASLAEAGGEVAETRSFPDHHGFTAEDIGVLTEAARAGELGLITTAKDHVRLATMPGIPRDFLASVAVLDVTLEFSRTDVPGHIVDTAIQRFKSRSRG
ncbi:MAG: tetraacyldisaccharide 4'-kinase [Rhizobiales bacterium]|nr:tetraacyldisaccharide 4'-kinase [Hyphomicrobiales bacterium]OJY07607.1 MAG: tetraacyldisaccharide 4'-kinase [Rhizobiales bacterium 63-22]